MVRGYRKEAIALTGIATVDNDRYAETGEVSFARLRARAARAASCIVVYGDILFRRYILDGLLAAEGDIVVAVDALWAPGRRTARRRATSPPPSRRFSGNYLDDAPVHLKAASAATCRRRETGGEWIGLARLTAARRRRGCARRSMRVEAEGRLDSARPADAAHAPCRQTHRSTSLRHRPLARRRHLEDLAERAQFHVTHDR